MRISLFFVGVIVVLCGMNGCAKPAEEATSAPQSASTPAPVSVPGPAPVATPGVVLPAGFAAHFHVHPEMTLSSAETVDESQAQYKVAGELRASSREVMDYFVKYFTEQGWEEDAVMEQEGNAVVSFKKDGYLQYVDSHEGGLGARITITTGKE